MSLWIIDNCHLDTSQKVTWNDKKEKLISFSIFLLRESTTLESDRVKIEFLTWPIIRYKREVLFGWVDLLVSFGGIAGLFLGFSLLSGIEIIYYFTVRAGCMMYKNRVSLRDDAINWVTLNFHFTTANCYYVLHFENKTELHLFF